MTAVGPKSTGTVASTQVDAGFETVSWSNPGNAVSSNNSYATATLATFDQTYALRCTNFGFTSSDVPLGATIDGILVEIEVSQDGDAKESGSQLTNGGSQIGFLGTVAPNAGFTPDGTDTYWPLGGSTDKAGASLTQAMIVDSSFGIDLYFAVDGLGLGSTVSVDHVRMTIYYTPGGGTTYNDNLTETAASSTSLSAVMTWRPTLAETGASTASLTATATMVPSLTETGAGAASMTAGLVMDVTGSETATATDAYSQSLTFAASLTETGASSDTLTAANTIASTLTETGAAADDLTNIVTLGVSLAEIATGGDSLTLALVFGPTLTEAATAFSTVDAVNSMAATISEAGTADAQLGGGLAFVFSLTETATSASSLTTAMTMRPTLGETATAGDMADCVATFATSLAEIASPAMSVAPSGWFYDHLNQSLSVTPGSTPSGLTVQAPSTAGWPVTKTPDPSEWN